MFGARCNEYGRLHSVFITAGWHAEKTLQNKSIGGEKESEGDGVVGNPQCLTLAEPSEATRERTAN